MNRHGLGPTEKSSYQRIRIKGVGTYFPDRRVSNETIAESAPVDPDWVREKLGVSERRICDPAQLTSDLAANAGFAALESASVDPDDVQMLIVATTTPDRMAPSTACLVQGKLNIRDTPAFDIGAACSGFLFAMTTAAQFIETGQCDNALVIGADTLSRVTDWTSRDCIYFGDGAGAAFVERSSCAKAYFRSSITADGCGQENFTVHPGASHFAIDPKGVYRSAKSLVSREASKVLKLAGLEPHEVDHVIPHQASTTLLKAIAEEIGVSFNKFWVHMDEYANTAAATVPIALNQAVLSDEVSDGDWLLIAAAGAGMTAGAAMYRWH